MSLISQRAKIEGFIVCVFSPCTWNFHSYFACSFDYASQFPAAIKELAGALAAGSIKRKFHVVEGLEKAPEGLLMLFSGGNTGKL
jgi:NADPH-dependent curcumin reductase CurA